MKTLNVVAAIIINQEKIFTTQRGYGNFKDSWEFPGGKIELGETPKEALAREIQEELNAVIEVGDLFYTVEYDYPEFHLHMLCYLCSIISGDIKLLEHNAAMWLSDSELWSVDWLPADVAVVKEIRNRGLIEGKGRAK